MAVATKTARTLVASTSTSAGASGTLNLATALGCLVMARVANGATPPAAGCLVTVSVSTDGSAWRRFAELRAGVAASTVYDWPLELPAPAMQVQVTFGATSQAVTVEALAHELTGVA